MSDDYTAPLGLNRPHPDRWRIRIWPVVLTLLILVVGTFAGWAIAFRDPLGGQPIVSVNLPVLPAKPAEAAAPAKPVEPPEANNGEIIIRDP